MILGRFQKCLARWCVTEAHGDLGLSHALIRSSDVVTLVCGEETTWSAPALDCVFKHGQVISTNFFLFSKLDDLLRESLLLVLVIRSLNRTHRMILILTLLRNFLTQLPRNHLIVERNIVQRLLNILYLRVDNYLSGAVIGQRLYRYPDPTESVLHLIFL